MGIAEQFDVVQINKRDSAAWLSSNRGDMDGRWIVTYVAGAQLVLFRDGMLLRIPSGDVHKVLSYDLDAMFQELRNLSHYVHQEADQKTELAKQ